MALFKLNAVVVQKSEIAPGLIIMRISPEGWELPDFKAGQFTVLGLPGSAKRCEMCDPDEMPVDPDKMIRRAYSIASGSREKEYMEFYIKLVHSGSLTPRLFALNVGDKLYLSTKMTGMFTLSEVPPDRNIILFATGTGVAPYMSMLRSSIIAHENRKYAVIHGALNSQDLGYRSELETIERFSGNFTYIPIISNVDNEPVPWNGMKGFLQSVWTNNILQEKWGMEIVPDNTQIFLCGHPRMIEDMIVLLGKKGFKEHSKRLPGSIHLEKF